MLLWDTRRDRVRSERASGHSVRRWVLRSAPRGRPANPARRRRRRRARPFRRVGRRVSEGAAAEASASFSRGSRVVLAVAMMVAVTVALAAAHFGATPLADLPPPGDLGAHAPLLSGCGDAPSIPAGSCGSWMPAGRSSAGGGGSGGQARHGLPRMPDSRVHHRDGRWTFRASCSASVRSSGRPSPITCTSRSPRRRRRFSSGRGSKRGGSCAARR